MLKIFAAGNHEGLPAAFYHQQVFKPASESRRLESVANVDGHAVGLDVAVVGTRIGEPERSGVGQLAFNAEADVGLVLELAALESSNAGVAERHGSLGFGITEVVRPAGVSLEGELGSAKRERNGTAPRTPRVVTSMS